MSVQLQIATFGGGCFWCIETVMNRLIGVEKALSGYMGGKIANPTYKEVCSGLTGHAEVVQVHFNPEIISFNTLLHVFFSMHDPTTLNRQGADIGTQYRSFIFFNDKDQKTEAEQCIIELEKNGTYSNIVTEISPAETFYLAEDYHQNYYNENRLSNSYCTVVIDPKVNKLRKSYAHLLKEA
ncbi:MAG: peptide-methionine (S)-S-oxide reductase MsrA [Bacteroidetes bacterium]|nr:peptide-methionine (S)-S-oxide reductase MsrA [Bacteroidota bacterium]